MGLVGTIISEGIIDYALIVMLLVQCDIRRVVMVSSWGECDVRDARQDQAR